MEIRGLEIWAGDLGDTAIGGGVGVGGAVLDSGAGIKDQSS